MHKKMQFLLLLLVNQFLLGQTQFSEISIQKTPTSNEPACENKRQLSDDKTICVCDATSCADLSVRLPSQRQSAILVQSNRAGLRFDVSKFGDIEPYQNLGHSDGHAKLTINISCQHQPIMGWGAAFTDSATINIKSLSERVSAQLIESYFGEKGSQYNFGRVPIAGTDFSTHAYSYDDTKEPDLALTNWTLTNEDYEFKIPVIKRAMAVAADRGTRLKLFGSPWSPPAWMKDNGDLVGGHLINDTAIYSSYANYTLKFYEAYRENGIEFWGGTVQNEPVVAIKQQFSFNSLAMNNDEMIKFIGDYLGPALEAKGYTRENFKLMIGDDLLGYINLQVPEIIKYPKVQRYVSGLAFHWYRSGSVVSYDELNSVIDSTNGQLDFVLMTEATAGFKPGDMGVDLGNWERAEEYALDIIEDLLHGTNGWIDWNMALDLQGGPSWAKNYVDSPIIVNSMDDEYYLQPTYYALAHFSRFFQPGSIRVNTLLNGHSDDLMAVAIHNIETGHLVINFLNKSNSTKTIDIVILGTSEESSDELGLRSFFIDGKSINTVVLKL